jgi:transposase
MASTNPFVDQGKALPSKVREQIVERWLSGTSQNQIARELNVAKSTIWSIINRFLESGHCEKKTGGDKTRTACTDDVVTYIEFCKKSKPSTTAREVQKKLVNNQVCLAQNVPSLASISRSLREDLG